MFILRTPAEMRAWSTSARHAGKTIGFVPTMGALHIGHSELIRQSALNNSETVVSIFVNPTQFNVQADFDKYPRTFDDDVRIATEAGATAIYTPTGDSMYPSGFRTFVEPGSSADPMEGEGRPGHFRGVATIVVKLLNAVSPDNAYFGQKDFQQLAVVTETISALDMASKIIGVPTVREKDGLAFSSRNMRLSTEARSDAPIIFRALTEAHSLFVSGERSRSKIEEAAKSVLRQSNLCKPEYVTAADAQTLMSEELLPNNAVLCIACWYGDVRLIDNIHLS